MAEGLKRAEVVEAVRRRPGRPSKGRGAKPRRPRPPSGRPRGCKVTVEHRKGVDDPAFRAALAEAMAHLDGKAEGRGSEAA